MEQFEISSGFVTGREHRRMHSNCQDAYYVQKYETCFVAVVCDGCSASPYSEVGARLASRFLACRLASLASSEDQSQSVESLLEAARLSLLDYLRSTSWSLGPIVEEIVHDYFLFTVVGLLATQGEVVFFSLGDGVIAANGTVVEIGPFPDNAPPYLGYQLISNQASIQPTSFVINRRMPTANLESFAIGTDGVRDMIAAEGKVIPGSDKVVPHVSEFWRDEIYFTNPAALTNKLRMLNLDVTRIDWQTHRRVIECGHLRDDTTLIVGRRVYQPEVRNDEICTSIPTAGPLEA